MLPSGFLSQRRILVLFLDKTNPAIPINIIMPIARPRLLACPPPEVEPEVAVVSPQNPLVGRLERCWYPLVCCDILLLMQQATPVP
jgi:hypothetical protein